MDTDTSIRGLRHVHYFHKDNSSSFWTQFSGRRPRHGGGHLKFRNFADKCHGRTAQRSRSRFSRWSIRGIFSLPLRTGASPWAWSIPRLSWWRSDHAYYRAAVSRGRQRSPNTDWQHTRVSLPAGWPVVAGEKKDHFKWL